MAKPSLDELLGSPSQSSRPSLDQLIGPAVPQDTSFLGKLGSSLRSIMPSSIQASPIRPGQTGMFGQQFLPAQQQEQALAQGRKGLDEAIPLALGTMAGIGTEGLAAPLIERGVSALGDTGLARVLGSGVSGALGGAAGSAAMGQNPIYGAAIGGPLGSVAQSASEAIPALARYVGGKVPVDEIKQRLETIPDDIKTSLAGLVGSSRLHKLEGVLESLPLSTVSKPYHQLNKFFSDTLDNIKSGDNLSKAEVGNNAYEDYKNNYLNAKQNTHNAYQKLSRAADDLVNKQTVPGQAGVAPTVIKNPFDRTEFDNAIQSIRNQIKPKMAYKSGRKAYSDINSILDDFEKTPMQTFKDANNAGELLNVLYRKNLNPEDYLTRSFLDRMKAGLEDSIDKSAQNYPEIAYLRNQAKDARIEQAKYETGPDGKRTPFFNLFNKKGATDTGTFLGRHLSPGSKTTDKSAFIRQLTDNVSPETRRMIATKAISPKGNETIAQIMKNIGSYSPEEREALFGEDTPEINRLDVLQSMYPEGKAPGFVPKTGFQGAKSAGGGALAYGIGSSLLHGNIPAAALLSIEPAVSMGVPALLRSKALRDLYIKGLTETPEIASPLRRTLTRLPAQAALSSENQ